MKKTYSNPRVLAISLIRCCGRSTFVLRKIVLSNKTEELARASSEFVSNWMDINEKVMINIT